MPKTLVEMASEIVAAQASHTPMTSEEIANEMRRIFEVLQSLHALETDRADDDDVEAGQNCCRSIPSNAIGLSVWNARRTSSCCQTAIWRSTV